MEKKTTEKNRVCPVAKKCGGCEYQGISYKEQLEKKQRFAECNLKEFKKVEPILGMADPYHYRNKVHAAFGRKKDGTIVSGVYQEGTHHIVPIDECLIENKKADAIIRDLRDLLKSFKIKIYNETSEFGLFRRALIRTGYKTGEIMVVLVMVDPVFPSRNNFVKALRKLHPEITTIIQNIHNRRNSMVLGERNQVLYGPGFIEDELCGCRFRISPHSFYQVNPVQTELLYQTAIFYAKLTGKETVIDAYCGIGTIGLLAAKDAEKVIGIESNKDAVKDAIGNAKRNLIMNARFYQGDAGTFMTGMAAENQQADVVFMDPPRAGSDEAFLSSVVKLKPKRIVYISCNPVTQARDLKYLVKKGYDVQKIQPVDMFPFVGHVETVALLTRKAQ